MSVPSDKARAVGESLERDMLTPLATQSDPEAVRRPALGAGRSAP